MRPRSFFYLENTMNKLISRQLIPAEQRMRHTAKLSGVHFPLVLEPFVYVTPSCLPMPVDNKETLAVMKRFMSLPVVEFAQP